MADPPRSERTCQDYRRRFRQLARMAERRLGKGFSASAFATLLIDQVRTQLSASSWRQYRSAVVFGLNEHRAARPQTARAIDAAIRQLQEARACVQRGGRLRTSQQKTKKMPLPDLDAITRSVLAGPSPHRKTLADLLRASDLAGLRPCEWPDAQLRASEADGFKWEICVASAKTTHGRSHGATRTLRFADLDGATLSALTDWIAVARKAGRGTREYERLLKTLRALMARHARKRFPRRLRRPTLYTPRHQAAARWKAFYILAAATPEEREHGRAVVATLLGHANDETQSQHYARPGAGDRGGSCLPIPAADPREVARVIRRFERKWNQLQSNRSSPAQPHSM